MIDLVESLYSGDHARKLDDANDVLVCINIMYPAAHLDMMKRFKWQHTMPARMFVAEYMVKNQFTEVD